MGIPDRGKRSEPIRKDEDMGYRPEPFYSDGTVICGAEPRGWYYASNNDPPHLLGPFKTREEALEDQAEDEP